MKLIIEIDLTKLGAAAGLREVADKIDAGDFCDAIPDSPIYSSSHEHCGWIRVERPTRSGRPVKVGKYWYWQNGAFTGRQLTDAELVEHGLTSGPERIDIEDPPAIVRELMAGSTEDLVFKNKTERLRRLEDTDIFRAVCRILEPFADSPSGAYACASLIVAGQSSTYQPLAGSTFAKSPCGGKIFSALRKESSTFYLLAKLEAIAQDHSVKTEE